MNGIDFGKKIFDKFIVKVILLDHDLCLLFLSGQWLWKVILYSMCNLSDPKQLKSQILRRIRSDNPVSIDVRYFWMPVRGQIPNQIEM